MYVSHFFLSLLIYIWPENEIMEECKTETDWMLIARMQGSVKSGKWAEKCVHTWISKRKGTIRCDGENIAPPSAHNNTYTIDVSESKEKEQKEANLCLHNFTGSFFMVISPPVAFFCCYISQTSYFSAFCVYYFSIHCLHEFTAAKIGHLITFQCDN